MRREKKNIIKTTIFMLLFASIFSCAEQELQENRIPGLISYMSLSYESQCNCLYTIDPNNGNSVLLTDPEKVDYFSWLYTPWSPDGKKLAFTRLDTTQDKYIICTMNSDGSDISSLTDGNVPAWSPNGSQLVYCKGNTLTNTSDIFKINIDGSKETNLTNHPAMDEAPVWSPDGSKIAFLSNRENIEMGAYEIWLVNADGSDQKILFGDVYVSQISWSPDGSQLAFTGGNSDVYLINIDGSVLKNLTNNEESHSCAWSPDGTKIAFLKKVEGLNSDIYLVNTDGTGMVNLTNNPDRYQQPSWSPDGNWLCYETIQESPIQVNQEVYYPGDLYILEIKSSKEIRLTNTTDNEYWAFWSPK